jgi:Spy/CpxP family protein refolding chaperone
VINKALALILIFSLAFNIAFVGIWAHKRMRPAGPRFGAPRAVPKPAPAVEGPLWRQLGLNPEQERSIVDDWRQAGRQIEATEAEVRQERARVINLLQANVLDEQAVRATREKMEEGQQKVRELVFNRMLHLRQVLTPDQRRRWLELMLRTSEARGGAKGPPPRNVRPPAQGGGPRGRGPGLRGPAAPPVQGPQP